MQRTLVGLLWLTLATGPALGEDGVRQSNEAPAVPVAPWKKNPGPPVFKMPRKTPAPPGAKAPPLPEPGATPIPAAHKIIKKAAEKKNAAKQPPSMPGKWKVAPMDGKSN